MATLNTTKIRLITASLAASLLSGLQACSSSGAAKQSRTVDLRKPILIDCSSPDPTKRPANCAPVPAVPGQGAVAKKLLPLTLTLDQMLEKVQAPSDEVAVQFFLDNCLSCHDVKNGSVASFWPLDKDQFSKQSLTVDPQAAAVFATLLFKAKDIVGSKPAAMPTGEMTVEAKAQLLPILKWMAIELPAAVQESQAILAGSELGKEIGGGVGVVLNFKCTQPATLREYLRRVVNDAFSREPTAAEFKLGSVALDQPVPLADRVNLSGRMLSDPSWKAEFEAKTLRKFAKKIAGSQDIQPIDGVITSAQATDLKEEFYQLLKGSYDKVAFADLLLSPQVMVSANTAPLYGCDVPSSGWAACTMKAPRDSFFTSVGYLRAKPSSFLATNNNYGRASVMQFIIRGDVLKPGFDVDGGSTKVKELPSCLKSKDFRGRAGTGVAWHGSSAIPLAANLCQSCHIDRYMAAASILYRPFNSAGQIYGLTAKVDSTDPDFAAATATDMVNQPGLTGPTQPVTAAFLQSLLATDNTEQACINALNAAGQDRPLKSVRELAAFLIGDGRAVAGGLARHLPRALSNLATTTEEVVVRIKQAAAEEKGLLGPMITAYFSSETYACKR